MTSGQHSKRLAIAGSIAGILFWLLLLTNGNLRYSDSSWKTLFFSIGYLSPLSFAAVIFGHLGWRMAAENGSAGGGRPFAATSLCLGYLGVILTAVLIRSVNPARHALGLEAGIVGSLRAIHSATHAYAVAHPPQGLPNSLQELGCPAAVPSAAPPLVADKPWCVDPEVAGGVKESYRLQYTPKKDATGRVFGYEVLADPLKREPYVQCHFFSDETNIIHYTCIDRPANRNDGSLGEH